MTSNFWRHCAISALKILKKHFATFDFFLSTVWVSTSLSKSGYSRVSSPRNVSEHVRSQIPLLGGRSPISGSGSHAHGESLVKVRLLEEENQRLMRKIKSLEQQLSDIEILHGKRVTELLNDRRREREKENGRQREVLR